MTLGWLFHCHPSLSPAKRAKRAKREVLGCGVFEAPHLGRKLPDADELRGVEAWAAGEVLNGSRQVGNQRDCGEGRLGMVGMGAKMLVNDGNLALSMLDDVFTRVWSKWNSTWHSHVHSELRRFAYYWASRKNIGHFAIIPSTPRSNWSLDSQGQGRMQRQMEDGSGVPQISIRTWGELTASESLDFTALLGETLAFFRATLLAELIWCVSMSYPTNCLNTSRNTRSTGSISRPF